MRTPILIDLDTEDLSGIWPGSRAEFVKQAVKEAVRLKREEAGVKITGDALKGLLEYCGSREPVVNPESVAARAVEEYLERKTAGQPGKMEEYRVVLLPELERLQQQSSMELFMEREIRMLVVDGWKVVSVATVATSGDVWLVVKR